MPGRWSAASSIGKVLIARAGVPKPWDTPLLRLSQNDAASGEATMANRATLTLAILAFVAFAVAITAAFAVLPWFPLGG